ncbi:MAG: VOC family protein [Mariniblastus sp.]
MHSNNVTHFAIYADDVERAKKFYQSAFGWKFEEWGPPEFYLVHTGEGGILGALQKRSEPVTGSGMIGFECSVSVQDVTETAKAIEKHGGSIVMKEVEIPTVGRLVKFCDTEGNQACAIQYSS